MPGFCIFLNYLLKFELPQFATSQQNSSEIVTEISNGG